MPVLVVDGLEPVEVHKENRGRRARPTAALNGVLEPLEEQDAVGQPGERVVQ